VGVLRIGGEEMSTATRKLNRSEQLGRQRRAAWARRTLRPMLIYAVLLFGMLFTLLPFLWMAAAKSRG
jgi:ABC-type glycerol-3-phosphate transport system permease component